MTPDPFRIAFGTFGWPGPMVDAVRALSDSGIDAVEGFGLHEMLRKDADLADVLRLSRMGFSGAYAAGSFVEPEHFDWEVDRFQRTVRGIRKLGGATVIVGGGRIFPENNAGHWSLFVRNLTRLAGVAKAEGVRLAYHPHRGTIVFRPDEIRLFLEETDPGLIGLTMDTAHVAAGCEGDMDAMLRLFEELQSRTWHVHLKDIIRPRKATTNQERKDTQPFSESALFVPLGGGAVPFPKVLAGLRDRGYKGWLTVELDASTNVLRDARLGLGHLRKCLLESGLATRIKQRFCSEESLARDGDTWD